LVYFFVLVRGTLPRFRYDKLINLAWKIILPRVLIRLVAICNILFFLV
jgi:NADH:ubiquinone oxidoreductase subunit H